MINGVEEVTPEEFRKQLIEDSYYSTESIIVHDNIMRDGNDTIYQESYINSNTHIQEVLQEVKDICDKYNMNFDETINTFKNKLKDFHG